MKLFLAILAVSLLGQGPTIAPSAEAAKPLAVGAAIPEAIVKDPNGHETKLSELLGGKKSVLIFYRGSWCPYCNAHLAGLQSLEGELKGLGYQIVAISPDRPEELAPLTEKHHLTYSLYSDSSTAAMQGSGLASAGSHVPLDAPAIPH